MRARAIREGSVGLLILIGVVLFGGLVLWLRGLNPGNRNYNMVVAFKSTAGMLVGTAVRYRGVQVGRVVNIQPSSNEVEVLVEITKSGLRIPDDALIEANQSGFIGETTVDITPKTELTEAEQAINPNGEDCDSDIIVCDGDRLRGQVGISYESLLRSTEALASTLGDPELISNLRTTLKNTAAFTERATVLADELTDLAVAANAEIGPLSESVRQASASTSAAAQEIQLTVADARSLLGANQFNLTNTLTNISRGSDRLVTVVDSIAVRLEDGPLLDNLEVLSTNAAEASFNLRTASVDLSEIASSVNQPENLLLVQQTLESARAVFQSAQKILSDVDELTGDPEIRNQFRELLNGLTDLLSNTKVLEQQVELAEALQPLTELQEPLTVTAPAPQPPLVRSPDHQKLQGRLQALETETETEAETEPQDDIGNDDAGSTPEASPAAVPSLR